jgi:hypothetical protein
MGLCPNALVPYGKSLIASAPVEWAGYRARDLRLQRNVALKIPARAVA